MVHRCNNKKKKITMMPIVKRSGPKRRTKTTKMKIQRKEMKKEEREKEWNSSGDNVEAVISDGISGKTVYYSPNNNKVNNVSDDDERSNDGVEEKGSVEYTIEEMRKNGL
ncbi:hypothetical protein Acr_20g0007790 [Actinidia rufa]|uniref:Uncharacterized protein n=1 Tax=Actinidia rufa TaxID=165716 RepID=A0A7J0GDY5_9ERIC|nr:hypothetical protein Acr_20g0007790 [Actinidia rufa]